MMKEILSLNSIMVNGCVSLFALSKNHVLHKDINVTQVQVLKGLFRND
jgi:hypothetical protein